MKDDLQRGWLLETLVLRPLDWWEERCGCSMIINGVPLHRHRWREVARAWRGEYPWGGLPRCRAIIIADSILYWPFRAALLALNLSLLPLVLLLIGVQGVVEEFPGALVGPREPDVLRRIGPLARWARRKDGEADARRIVRRGGGER